MFIPQGDWIVVTRKIRGEETKRGRIIKSGLTESQARDYCAECRKHESAETHNYWAMHKTDY